ncbi:MAG: 2-C-methyl-D-erythritol 4-phosphate cytidylyltransferase [Acidimicrobiales bacterium]
MVVWAVVVAGGRGLRFGCPKQFAILAGRPVLDWSLEAARSVASGVVLALPADGDLEAGLADVAVHGGATRSASVRAGLAAVPGGVDVVVVHDAARPLATPALFRAVLAPLEVEAPTAGAVPALPVVETVKRVLGGRVVATVDRHDLVTVQTPQAFRTGILRSAHRAGAEGTDDAALVEAAGGTVLTVPGDPSNLKLTAPSDLALAEALLQARAGSGRPAGA